MGWCILGGILFLSFILCVWFGLDMVNDDKPFLGLLIILFSFYILAFSITTFAKGNIETCESCQQNHTIEVDGQCLTYPIDEDGDCEKCNHNVTKIDCNKTEIIVTCHCCQTKVKADETYCSQCGNELKQETLNVSENTITYCTGCGVELQPEDKYCGSCGNAN